MLNRRAFLRSSPLLTLSATVPLFAARSVSSAAPTPDSRVLVVVELDGGNDAHNTVVPFADADYARLRPRLKQEPKTLVKLNDSVGLHSALKPLAKLLEAGRLAAIPGVGYPNPNRSHFESMSVWHTASFDAEDRKGYGWLGRAFDPSAGQLYSIGGDVPTALRGRRSTAVAFNRADDLLLSDRTAIPRTEGTGKDDLLDFVRRQAVDTLATADKLALLKEGSRSGYPATPFGERLRLVSRLVQADLGARVYYTQQSGYDTHARQEFAHANLLGDFARSVAAFFADLKEAKLDDRVTLVSFSEFGRTIQENDSGGTDHGTAGAMFVAGPTVQGHLLGTMPSLTELEKGEPKMTTDFRGVYRALLRGWLGLNVEAWAKDVPAVELFR
jgi:uncharacterized protein (DUF1501 family)